MNGPDPTMPDPDAAWAAAELARGLPATPARHDERWRGGLPSTGPAPGWQQLLTAIGRESWPDGADRAERLRQRLELDGASYVIHGEERAHPWSLEQLPYLVEPEAWAEVERGVIQRARLMEAVMQDLYGPQTLLRDAALPASLVYAHPQFLREVARVEPAGGHWLKVLAFDLKRGPDGRHRVLAQRLQAPSGLGYALENRLVVRQVFEEAFQHLRVQHLASSYRHLLQGLVAGTPEGERPHAVLLTPGRHNETYFEHVFLATYLGITLVEGSDLTVRGQKLYLKTMRGLERVHAVLRRVDDDFLDPLELNAQSWLGVPGLLQAIRAGNVVMANMPGCGVLESPGLAAFWPRVCEALLGEPLSLHAPTSWWCGEASVWRRERDRLANYVIAPTFPDAGFGPFHASDLDLDRLQGWRERIDADPAAYTLQAPAQLSETPVWTEAGLEPRAVVWRAFALRDGRGKWRVLPGGLARVAASRDAQALRDPWLSMQHGSASADTWVLTRGHLDGSSMLPRPLRPADLRSNAPGVTSRAAENLFWLGRYTERAQQAVQLAGLLLTRLPGARRGPRRLLKELAQWHHLWPDGLDEAADTASAEGFVEAVVRAHREGQRMGLRHVLERLAGCAQAVRERLTGDHWQWIVRCTGDFEAAVRRWRDGHDPGVGEVQALLDATKLQLAAITAAQTDSMQRDEGWQMLSLGRHLERLDAQATLMAQAFEQGAVWVDDGFELVLTLSSSLISYRARYQTRRETLPFVHLLVFDTANPRSLALLLRTVRDLLRGLGGAERRWLEALIAQLPQPERWSLAGLVPQDSAADAGRLMALLESCQSAAQALAEGIDRQLILHVSTPQRLVMQ